MTADHEARAQKNQRILAAWSFVPDCDWNECDFSAVCGIVFTCEGGHREAWFECVTHCATSHAIAQASNCGVCRKRRTMRHEAIV